MNNFTDAIKHLIIINVIVFVAPQLMQSDFTNILALHFPKNDHFGFWQYVTHMFMHGGFAHILFNMYGLWAFGTPLEQMWGKNKFIFFYNDNEKKDKSFATFRKNEYVMYMITYENGKFDMQKMNMSTSEGEIYPLKAKKGHIILQEEKSDGYEIRIEKLND